MTVYFDSTVFLSVLNGEEAATKIRSLLSELQAEKVRIYTSIVTVQEVSVGTFKDGTPVSDNMSKVRRLARIEGVTRDVAMTAAKLEAQIIDGYKNADAKKADNPRRKWDCFHMATALHLGCTRLYTLDDKFLSRQASLKVKNIQFLRPDPSEGQLFELR